MAVYKIFPTKDASVYSLFPEMNTGVDQILDINNLNFNFNPVPAVARALVYFDNAQLNDVLENKVGLPTSVAGTGFTGSYAAKIKSYIATAQGINLGEVIEAYPIVQEWSNGTGTYLDQPLTVNGVSWKYRTPSGSGNVGEWFNQSDFPVRVTGSYSGSVVGGGAWWTGSSDGKSFDNITQSFQLKSTKDLDLEITTIVQTWYSSSFSFAGHDSSISNQGIILKLTGSSEFNDNINDTPSFQFYSADTHTIYPPTLEIQWDDYSFDTGSSTFNFLNTAEAYVSIDDNPGIFYSESINRFRVNARPKFPTRVWQTASIYTTQHYLPSASSYYAIKDLDTNEYVVDFNSTYTKISADSTSSYFDIYMNGLQPERYYKILIQTTVGGSTLVFDDNYSFKVVNG